ncbi:hypothetical protein NZNM25_03070 [Nitrosopumilus zosterae]|uniref:MarR family transcriptional regulator n=1 Tax=Nitrosopumilus zosterae TaxID=718286 RepID=A0A2S2KPD4_9ARCH|nr:hypothetical protein [Nitrosopumilus zosterae]BDQ31306.1 hypothetical protein NZOSNM25_001419 [Nitrosopumilus zosterae]GBH33516.1 hypothetical protein NZNM25_03070 [Nitrosopumilus zosterae]
MSEEIVEKLSEIQKQNQIIISLLAKLVLKEEEVKEIIINRKTNPKKYIEGYNACDGKHTINEIIKIVGVKQQTLSPILQEWENKGILYSFEKKGLKFYNNYFKI